MLLDVKELRAGYGPAEILHGVNVTVDAGEVVVILGANGAGKTTLMRALAGVISRRGQVWFDGKDITARSAYRVARAGIRLVPQGRGTFANLTVRDNLRIGALTSSSREVEKQVATWCDRFPNLGKYVNKRAGLLSGGEQQMLALARALISRPRMLFCDEPSLGLAPVIVRQLFDFLREVNETDGTSMLVVEQNAERALALASRAYLIEGGQVVGSGPANEIAQSDAVRRAYLGI